MNGKPGPMRIQNSKKIQPAARTARPEPPRLGKASTGELVKLLAHTNGWRRDTASRLLYQRQDKAAVAPLKAPRNCRRSNMASA